MNYDMEAVAYLLVPLALLGIFLAAFIHLYYPAGKFNKCDKNYNNYEDDYPEMILHPVLTVQTVSLGITLLIVRVLVVLHCGDVIALAEFCVAYCYVRLVKIVISLKYSGIIIDRSGIVAVLYALYGGNEKISVLRAFINGDALGALIEQEHE